jgi:hypothetical protein
MRKRHYREPSFTFSSVEDLKNNSREAGTEEASGEEEAWDDMKESSEDQYPTRETPVMSMKRDGGTSYTANSLSQIDIQKNLNDVYGFLDIQPRFNHPCNPFLFV